MTVNQPRHGNDQFAGRLVGKRWVSISAAFCASIRRIKIPISRLFAGGKRMKPVVCAITLFLFTTSLSAQWLRVLRRHLCMRHSAGGLSSFLAARDRSLSA